MNSEDLKNISEHGESALSLYLNDVVKQDVHKYINYVVDKANGVSFDRSRTQKHEDVFINSYTYLDSSKIEALKK